MKKIILTLLLFGCHNSLEDVGHTKVTKITNTLGTGYTVREMRDNTHHVTCWITGEAISCLRDEK